MAAINIAKAASISAATILIAILVPILSSISSPLLTSFIGDFPLPDYPLVVPFKYFTNSTTSSQPNNTNTTTTPPPFTCDPLHTYKTEIISLSPLLLYIHNLLTPHEITHLLTTSSPQFRPSAVSKPGHATTLQTPDRTSSSAGLPPSDPAVSCILRRTRNYLGTLIRDGWDEMGSPQLVRYTAGQRFNTHHDWFETPRWANDDSNRKWNRMASFFAVLQDNCTGGETWFPYVEASVAGRSPRGGPVWRGGLEDQVARGLEGDELRPLWREHEEGGLAFRPVAGNALFWINLHANGTGDERTNHAGLPLGEGIKTAMNIWPRVYYDW